MTIKPPGNWDTDRVTTYARVVRDSLVRADSAEAARDTDRASYYRQPADRRRPRSWSSIPTTRALIAIPDKVPCRYYRTRSTCVLQPVGGDMVEYVAACENHLVVTTPAAVRARAWRAANPAAATAHLAELRSQHAGEPDRTAAVRVHRYRLRRQHRRRTDAAQVLGLPPPPPLQLPPELIPRRPPATRRKRELAQARARRRFETLFEQTP